MALLARMIGIVERARGLTYRRRIRILIAVALLIVPSLLILMMVLLVV